MVTPDPATTDQAARNEAHNQKMRKIKEARDKLMATKTEEKADCCPYRRRQRQIIFWFRYDHALYRASDALRCGPVHQGNMADR